MPGESGEHVRRLEGEVRLDHAGSHGPLYGALSHSGSCGGGERGVTCVAQRDHAG